MRGAGRVMLRLRCVWTTPTLFRRQVVRGGAVGVFVNFVSCSSPDPPESGQGRSLYAPQTHECLQTMSLLRCEPETPSSSTVYLMQRRTLPCPALPCPLSLPPPLSFSPSACLPGITSPQARWIRWIRCNVLAAHPSSIYNPPPTCHPPSPTHHPIPSPPPSLHISPPLALPPPSSRPSARCVALNCSERGYGTVLR